MEIQLPAMTITILMIAITVIVSWYAFEKKDVMSKLIMNPYRVSRLHEYYRFITSGLLHADFMHLLVNMISFYFCGSIVEYYFNQYFGSLGSYYYVGFYIVAIIVSDIPSYFKHKNHSYYNSLGASGGVSAIVLASIIFQPLAEYRLYFIIPVPGFILGIGFILWSYYKGRKANDNINHEAHLYGALFGVLFCLVLIPSSLVLFIEQLMYYRLPFLK